MTARVWITDGSWPVFSDTTRLRAKHPALFFLPTRYEGFVDPAVPRGSASFRTERADDALYVEAEWLVEFRDGIDRYLERPELVDAATEITVQGMIEGKWMNRLLGTTAWRPASMGNSLIATGPGLAMTVGALDWGEGGSMRLSYRTATGAVRTQEASVAALRGHNALGLIREVLRACAESGEAIDGINLGAVGESAAIVNERERFKAAAHPVAHMAKERLVRAALDERLGLPPGSSAAMVVVDPAGKVVGEGELTLEAGE
jgi:hypothetical protein